MGLKQSIVIVNEYTIKNGNGGSRGGTPGDYVLRYMARKGATEGLTPIRLSAEPFTDRYDERSELTDKTESVLQLKKDMYKLQGYGGVGFGYGEPALSDSALRAAAKDIQANFERGKTVMKTVISFDEEYLRKNGIIAEDFEFQAEGDYRGNIDQLKLRMAIMNGMDKLARGYDDLQYIGVIQVDTRHVHCHLAMVDRGRGNITRDGTQRGKILESGKNALRHGIDLFIDEKQTVRMLSSNTEYDRRNTVCFVKKYTHKAMDNRGFAQFLLACLPDDRRLWHASSNRREMQKPNAIVREYVNEVLTLPDSGYREALASVDRYARNRVKEESLTGEDYRRFYAEGQRRIVESCMNSVYSVLGKIPTDEFYVRTPMIETMALPYESMAAEAASDPMIEFGFKLRSYKARLDHHRNERHKYHEAVRDYEQAQRSGDADESSRPLYDYFKFEEEYNAMLMAKYQYFLNFLPPEDEYMRDFEDIMAYRDRIYRTRGMLTDTEMRRMPATTAENYGLQVYGEEGGRMVVTNPAGLEARVQRMEDTLAAMQEDYRVKLSDYGLSVGEDGRPSRVPEYRFDDVKALDLHHLLYDFPYDFEISVQNTDRFVEMTRQREQLFNAAKQYLESTGQASALESLPVRDIEAAVRQAERFGNSQRFATARNTSERVRRQTHTISMSSQFYDEQEAEIRGLIKDTVNTLQIEFE